MSVADLYCSRADLYRYGLPRGILGMSARECASAIASTDVVTLDDHGFETDDPVVFRPLEGGTMAAPLVSGTTYYAIRLNSSTFKVAATAGGGAINLTGDAVSMAVATELPYDEVIEFYSRWVDGCVPHVVPFASPVPVIVKGIVAELAAKKLAQLAGHTSASLNEAELAAKAQLERWFKGAVVRDARATSSSNKAVVSSITASAPDPRGWGTGVLP